MKFPGVAKARALPAALVLLVILCGCSVKKFAINKLGDSLANSGTTFASDNDPELIADALPFSLKLIESLLAESPKHRGLIFAASSGFTQYAYVFIQQDAERMETQDLAKSNELRDRARNLYLRARDYGLRGLDVRHAGLSVKLKVNPKPSVSALTKADVPLAYWTALSWGAAISVSKDNPDLVADQLAVEALIDRAYALDPDFDFGAIDGFLITYESARQGVTGKSSERSRTHFARALLLTKGQLAAPYVSLAETVSVADQNRVEFEALLNKALAVDPNARPEWRLNNLVMKRRARWLLSRIDDLFLTSEPAPSVSLLRVPVGW